MQCEKCHQAQMVQDRVSRMSGYLVAIGYFLLIPGMLLMLGGIGFTILGVGAGAESTPKVFEDITRKGVEKLNREGIDSAVIEEYKKGRGLSQTTMSAIPEEKRSKVAHLLQMDEASKAGAAIGTASVAVCGGAFTMMTFLIGLPSFIIGFILILKRNVWRCPTCGYIFDRA